MENKKLNDEQIEKVNGGIFFDDRDNVIKKVENEDNTNNEDNNIFDTETFQPMPVAENNK